MFSLISKLSHLPFLLQLKKYMKIGGFIVLCVNKTENEECVNYVSGCV